MPECQQTSSSNSRGITNDQQQQQQKQYLYPFYLASIFGPGSLFSRHFAAAATATLARYGRSLEPSNKKKRRRRLPLMMIGNNDYNM